MPLSDMLLEGVRLMVIGMGIVYAFLLLLVGVLRVLSLGVRRWAPQALAAPRPKHPREPARPCRGVRQPNPPLCRGKSWRSSRPP